MSEGCEACGLYGGLDECAVCDAQDAIEFAELNRRDAILKELETLGFEYCDGPIAEGENVNWRYSWGPLCDGGLTDPGMLGGTIWLDDNNGSWSFSVAVEGRQSAVDEGVHLSYLNSAAGEGNFDNHMLAAAEAFEMLRGALSSLMASIPEVVL